MTEDYLKTIIQYLIKIVNNGGVSDKGISEKLDEVIAAVSNIKISAESVNLNTDEVEAKLDTLNQSIINNGSNSDIVEKLTALGTKLDTIKAAVDILKTNIESVDTHIQSNTQALNNAAGDINTHLDNIDTHIQSLTQALNNGVGVVNEKQDATNNNITSISQKMLVSGIINPTHIAAVAAGDTTFDQHVVLCNITDNNISVTIMAADDSQNTTIVLAPGWNPVVVKSITGAVENTLVYGY